MMARCLIYAFHSQRHIGSTCEQCQYASEPATRFKGFSYPSSVCGCWDRATLAWPEPLPRDMALGFSIPLNFSVVTLAPSKTPIGCAMTAWIDFEELHRSFRVAGSQRERFDDLVHIDGKLYGPIQQEKLKL